MPAGGGPGAAAAAAAEPPRLFQRPYVCQYEGCGKSFTRDFHRARHFLTHSGERPFE